MFDDPPACWLHRQASFINAVLPAETPRPASTTTGSRFRPIDQEGILFAGELTVVGKNGNRPEVIDFLERFIGQEVQCEMGGVPASSRSRRTSNVDADCYANDILADASVILTEALDGGHRAVRRVRPDAGRGGAAGASGPAWSSTCRKDPDSLDGMLDDIEASWPRSGSDS